MAATAHPGELRVEGDGLPALGRYLAEARCRGYSFPVAWSMALAALGLQGSRSTCTERDTLATAVAATRDGWRRAYEGRPPTCGDTAAARLPGLVDA
jgi:hypothetical protein